MVKITLEVTTKQALDIFKLLNEDIIIPTIHKEEPKHASPTETGRGQWPDLPPMETLSINVEPSPKTGTKMPSFGRTPKQIEQFNIVEQERFERQTEEELLKAQRKADREAKKAAKEAEADKALKDALALKEAEDKQVEKEQEVLEKPTWKL